MPFFPLKCSVPIVAISATHTDVHEDIVMLPPCLKAYIYKSLHLPKQPSENHNLHLNDNNASNTGILIDNDPEVLLHASGCPWCSIHCSPFAQKPTNSLQTTSLCTPCVLHHLLRYSRTKCSYSTLLHSHQSPPSVLSSTITTSLDDWDYCNIRPTDDRWDNLGTWAASRIYMLSTCQVSAFPCT